MLSCFKDFTVDVKLLICFFVTEVGYMLLANVRFHSFITDDDDRVRLIKERSPMPDDTENVLRS